MSQEEERARRSRTRSTRRGGGVVGVVTAVALLAAAPAAGLPAAAAGQGSSAASVQELPPGATRADSVPELGDYVRYEVAVRPDGGSREVVWRVVQGPDVASLFSPSRGVSDLGAAWALSGPAVGGRPWLVKGDRRTLVPMWEEGPSYRPGVTASRGRARTVVRDLDYRFSRGASDRAVAGRRAQHWVLEADLRVIFEPRGFGRGLGADSADVHLRTDFWFLRGVPFSWAPFAATGVEPLSVGLDPVTRLLREDLESRFRRLGLPVATETCERWEPFGTPDVAIPSDSRRRSRVRRLEPASPPAADPGVLDYERVTEAGSPAPGDQSAPSSSSGSSSSS